jgi:hypothetical protein
VPGKKRPGEGSVLSIVSSPEKRNFVLSPVSSSHGEGELPHCLFLFPSARSVVNCCLSKDILLNTKDFVLHQLMLVSTKFF